MYFLGDKLIGPLGGETELAAGVWQNAGSRVARTFVYYGEGAMNLFFRQQKSSKPVCLRFSGRSLRWLAFLAAGLVILSGTAPPVWASPPSKHAYEQLRLRGKTTFFEVPLPEGVDAPSSPDKVFPTVGTNGMLLVLLVDFSSQAGVKTDDNFETLLFTGANSMADYYSEVSYNQFSVEGEAYPNTGWYRVSQPVSYYVNSNGGMYDTYPKNSQKLVKEAVLLADSNGVDFSKYDIDDNGYVDVVAVVFAGYGAEYDGDDKNKLWSHRWKLSGGNNGPGAITVDGKVVDDYFIAPELAGASGTTIGGIGVFCHEYGHVLGLPDLYSTVWDSYQGTYGYNWGLGTFCLMAYGSWGADWDTPTKPTHLCAWAKAQLGWLTPTNVPWDLLDEQIHQVETNQDVYRLWTNGEQGSQYFLVENRQKVGFDADLPGSGLLIYHVDDNVKSGNFDGDSGYYYRNNWDDNQLQWDEKHKFIDLECADQSGADHTANADVLDSTGAEGSAATFFSSTTDATFGTNGITKPSSLSYSGADTNVEVSDVRASANPMTADLLVGLTPPPDLWIKDCPTDNGQQNPPQPLCSDWWTSDDIWIDNKTNCAEPVHEDAPVVDGNYINTLCVRVRNRAPQPTAVAGTVTVKAYYRDNSTGLVFPGQGAGAATLIGTKSIGAIPSGQSQITSFTWDIPEPPTTGGHYCIGAIATNPRDPQTSQDPWRDNNVGSVNILVLYARAGSGKSSGGGLRSCVDPTEPVVADFNMENPTTQTKQIVFVADADVPPAWTVEFEDQVTHEVWQADEVHYAVLAAGEVRPVQMRASPVSVSHGQSERVRVVQYDENYYPSTYGIMGGIDFWIRVDCYPPILIDDLVAMTVLDTGGEPGAAPLVLLDFTPVTTDVFGNPEHVAYYNVYRDTDPDVVPGPLTRVARILQDANPGFSGWQYYDDAPQLGPWWDRRTEYYYVLGVVDEAGYESGYSIVAGTGNVMDNGTIRATMHEFGGSGQRLPSGEQSSDITWLAYSPDPQVDTWQGNLHYNDGTGLRNHFLSPGSGDFEVLEAAHYVAGEVFSRIANSDFDIKAGHRLEGRQLITVLEITNISGGALTGVDFAWMLDADLVLADTDPREPCCVNYPWVGHGSARWFGGEGQGMQTNLNHCAEIVPANLEVVHTARMDGSGLPGSWTVGNPSGFQGSTCAFDGQDDVWDRYLFNLGFDNTEGCAGFNQDLAIVTDFDIASWPNGTTHTVTYTLTFGQPGDPDADGAIDLADYGAFSDCLGGPAGSSITSSCQTFDFDCDDDVDLGDFATLQTMFTCGNGVIDGDEQCDDGGESSTCDDDCTAVVCGDGMRNPTAGEECDPPNGTTCDANCRRIPTCGDGFVDPGEECDPPNGTTCDANCQRIPVCGDGFVDGSEECDPPNGTTCDESCQRIPICGDGFVDGSEECDEGGESATCDADCTFAVCGDGTLNVTAGEQCDDGNTNNGDGCSSTCQIEQQPLPPCMILFEPPDPTCPNMGPVCGAFFVGGEGCVPPPGPCFQTPPQAYLVQPGPLLNIILSGDLNRLSVFFSGFMGSMGMMVFYDAQNAQVGPPLFTNGDCQFGPPPPQYVVFGTPVRRIEVQANGGYVWIDSLHVNPP